MVGGGSTTFCILCDNVESGITCAKRLKGIGRIADCLYRPSDPRSGIRTANLGFLDSSWRLIHTVGFQMLSIPGIDFDCGHEVNRHLHAQALF